MPLNGSFFPFLLCLVDVKVKSNDIPHPFFDINTHNLLYMESTHRIFHFQLFRVFQITLCEPNAQFCTTYKNVNAKIDRLDYKYNPGSVGWMKPV